MKVPHLILLILLFFSPALLFAAPHSDGPCTDPEPAPYTFRAECQECTPIEQIFESCPLCEVQYGPCVNSTNPVYYDLDITGNGIDWTYKDKENIVSEKSSTPHNMALQYCMHFLLKDAVNQDIHCANLNETGFGSLLDPFNCSIPFLQFQAYRLDMTLLLRSLFGGDDVNTICQNYFADGAFFGDRGPEPVKSYLNAYINSNHPINKNTTRSNHWENEILGSTTMFVMDRNQTNQDFKGTSTIFVNATFDVYGNMITPPTIILSTLHFHRRLNPPVPEPFWGSWPPAPPPSPPPPMMKKRDVDPAENEPFNPKKHPFYLFHTHLGPMVTDSRPIVKFVKQNPEKHAPLIAPYEKFLFNPKNPNCNLLKPLNYSPGQTL